jgi:hypothetical protein
MSLFDFSRRTFEASTLTLAALVAPGCSTLGSDLVSSAVAEQGRTRFFGPALGRNQLELHTTSSVGERLAERYANAFLPNIHRLESLQLTGPLGSDARFVITIELDPDDRSGTLRAVCLRVRNDEETVSPMGPVLLGTYSVGTEYPAHGVLCRTLTLTSSSPIAQTELQLTQKAPTQGSSALEASRGRSPLDITISFTPSIIARAFGLKPFAIVHPLRLTLDHGEMAEIAELRERDLSGLITRHRNSFVDPAGLTTDLLRAERWGRYHGALRCRPQSDVGEHLVERWVLPRGEYEIQTVFTVRRGPPESNPSFRVIGISPAAAEVIDAPVILGSPIKPGAIGRRISWPELSATQGSPPHCALVIATSLNVGGISRRIEFPPGGIDFSADLVEHFFSFLEGVTATEQRAGIPPGNLVIRIVLPDIINGTRRWDIIDPPLGTVTWSPDAELELEERGVGTARERHYRAGLWSARHALALALAHTTGAEALDRILPIRTDDIRLELENFITLAHRLGAAAPNTLNQRTDLTLLALAIAETPTLAEPIDALTAPTKSLLNRILQVVEGLRNDTMNKIP